MGLGLSLPFSLAYPLGGPALNPLLLQSWKTEIDKQSAEEYYIITAQSIPCWVHYEPPDYMGKYLITGILTYETQYAKS
jgi:hypothetical protein